MLPGLRRVLGLKDYAERQIEDAVLFGALALRAGYELNAQTADRLKKSGRRFVRLHGSPTLERVRAWLRLPAPSE